MFIPNTNVLLFRSSGFDLHGKPSYKKVGDSIPACAVKVSTSTHKTSLRSNTSATEGASAEKLADVRFLMAPTSNPKTSDAIEYRGVRYQIIGIRERFNVFGAFDHVQVDGDVWQG